MKKIKPLELSSKENQVHKVLSSSRQMQRTQQNFGEENKPQNFQKGKNFLNRRKKNFYKEFFQAYLQSRISHLKFRKNETMVLCPLKGKAP